MTLTNTLQWNFYYHPWCHIVSICHYELTNWGRDKMAAILQTPFSNTFSWMKMNELRLIFHWSLFLRVQLIIFQHWFRLWLGTDQVTSHYLNQWWSVYWHICASFSLNELRLHHSNPIHSPTDYWPRSRGSWDTAWCHLGWCDAGRYSHAAGCSAGSLANIWTPQNSQAPPTNRACLITNKYYLLLTNSA